MSGFTSTSSQTPPRARLERIYGESLPSRQMVESWTGDDLNSWLCSLSPPPLGKRQEDIERFCNANVSGVIFLTVTEAWFAEKCGVPVGVARILCMLAEAINSNPGQSSEQNTGNTKRGGSPEVNDPRGTKGKKARLVREQSEVPEQEGPTIQQRATHLNKLAVEELQQQINMLSIDAVRLSQPGASFALPFPYPGVVPERFHLGQEGQFEFFGRHKFAELYKVVKDMNPRQRKRVHFHGTLGAGKSHLLAALVCLLRKEGAPVVYLPDCYELLTSEPPELYLITALFASFWNDTDLSEEVTELFNAVLSREYNHDRLEWDILVFCNLAAQLKKTILFVVDQANALDDSPDDRIGTEKKQKVRKLLDGISSNHLKISSSTANYHAAKHDEFRATSETRLTLYKGLDDDEIKTWWKACEQKLDIPRLSEEQRVSLEHLTGRMPLLLRAFTRLYNNLIDNVSSNATLELTNPVPEIYQAMMDTVEVQKVVGGINKFATMKIAELNASKDDSALQSFRRGWEGCVFEQPIDIQDATHLDGRFFYRDATGVGRVTCDIARAVGASRLREVDNLADFVTKSWMKRISHSGANPSVLGFLVERVVLGILVQHGTTLAGPEFAKPLHPVKFSGTLPQSPPSKNNTPVIYIPTAYNYEGVDAILVTRIQKKKNEPARCVIVGIQVTIAQNHSNSEEAFMKTWMGWDELAGGKRLNFGFFGSWKTCMAGQGTGSISPRRQQTSARKK
ncbi:hypothetical protein BDZ91DRAFT_850755 [Kalaharituber pfeilii]|nr:hypothetical protein BDZ91DRAFT_850755 [Kalaharituber pfeilii]